MQAVMYGENGGGCHDALAFVLKRRAQKPQPKHDGLWGIQSKMDARAWGFGEKKPAFPLVILSLA